jgi:hypothetical protein
MILRFVSRENIHQIDSAKIFSFIRDILGKNHTIDLLKIRHEIISRIFLIAISKKSERTDKAKIPLLCSSAILNFRVVFDEEIGKFLELISIHNDTTIGNDNVRKKRTESSSFDFLDFIDRKIIGRVKDWWSWRNQIIHLFSTPLETLRDHFRLERKRSFVNASVEISTDFFVGTEIRPSRRNHTGEKDSKG